MKAYLIIVGILFSLCIASFILVSKLEDGSIGTSFLSGTAVVVFSVFKFPLFLLEHTNESKIFIGNLYFVALCLNIAFISALLRFFLHFFRRFLPKNDQNRQSHRLNHYF
jgi:hypothetical protein